MSDKIAKKDQWWKSAGLWAGVAAVAGVVAGAFGVDAAGFTDALSSIGEGVIAVVGGITSAIAVIVASKKNGGER